MTSTESMLIKIAATFTADPITEPIRFWLAKLGITAEVELAPYNQVFQQLVDPASELSRVKRGFRVVLVRPEDWLPADLPHGDIVASATRTGDELIAALRSAAPRSPAQLIVCFCPSSPAAQQDARRAAVLRSLEDKVFRELRSETGVLVTTSNELGRRYPADDYHDAYANELGHVPYTAEGFAAIGTMVTRTIAATAHAYKVIVLDCDNTLWKGVCAEDGALGVRVDPPWLALQEFMVEQCGMGKLLCLCSKNVESDVMEVFVQRTDMPLSLEHIVAHRINWNPKSDNLQSLADELKLGLDSFIFLDDNPVECAEVQHNCGNALTLLLPPDPADIPRFLDHVWAFDQFKAFDEDRRRTELYRQDKEREAFLRGSMTLDDFVSGLGLEISVWPFSPAQLPRVAQLTQRTNQFNTTTIRRTESELQTLLADEHECLVVHVRDRFGDYGLVGAVLVRFHDRAITVDSMLLSCRALGRGVEHEMLARIGEIAVGQGVADVDVLFAPTKRNQPALAFLDSIGPSYRRADGNYRVPASVLAQLRFSARTAEPVVDEAKPRATSSPAPRRLPFQEIGEALWNTRQVVAALPSVARPTGSSSPSSGTGTSTEERVAQILSELLGFEPIEITDNLFELGIPSVTLVRLASRINTEFAVGLTRSEVFELPSIADIARVVDAQRSAGAPRAAHG